MRRGPWVVSAVLPVLVLAPVMTPGYALTYDMVFVPTLDLTRDVVGLGDGLPRAVPVDALVALISQVVPGSVLQKAVLLATLVLAGLGAARLTTVVLPADRGAAATVAAAAYIWNPYVAERLVIGHWALLVAYAALPWLVVAAHEAGAGDRRALARVGVLLAVCAVTPTGGLLGGLVAAAVLAGRARSGWWAAPIWLVVNAPWWLPGVAHDAVAATRDTGAAGVDAFAVRGEGVLGVAGSVAGLGGIWSSGTVPGSRETLLGLTATLLWVGLAALGAGPLRRGATGLPGRLLVAALVGLGIAIAGALPGSREVLGEMVQELPAAGLLRDGHKWLAPYAVLLAVAVGAGAGVLAARAREVGTRPLVPVAVVVALMSVLPDLAWGVAGRLVPVSYPAEWAAVRRTVQERGGGDVVVLPWGAFRAFDWNDRRTVLDPATRYLPGSVVASDDLVVGDLVVAGEGRRAAAAEAALAGADPSPGLRALGVRWVLVHRGQPGPPPRVPDGQVALSSRTLTLVRLAGPVAGRPLPAATLPVLVADAVAAAFVVIAAGRGYSLVQFSRRTARSRSRDDRSA